MLPLPRLMPLLPLLTLRPRRLTLPLPLRTLLLPLLTLPLPRLRRLTLPPPLRTLPLRLRKPRSNSDLRVTVGIKREGQRMTAGLPFFCFPLTPTAADYNSR